MTFKKLLITSLGILFLCAGCSVELPQAQVPQWYIDGRSGNYTAPQYFVGVGEASTLQEAQNLARTSVGAQIRVQVDAEITTISREIQTGDRFSFESDFQNATTSKVEETLLGLEMVKQAQHAGMYYAMAVLHRETYLQGIRSDLQRIKNEYHDLVSRGEQSINEGRIFAGITNYLDAQQLTFEFYALMATYNALSNIPFGSGDELGLGNMVTEIRSVLEGISMDIVAGDQQTGSRGRELSEPVVVSVTYNRSGKSVAVTGMPIRVEYQDGSVADRVTTGNDGTASIRLTAVPVRQQTNRVTFRPIFTEIPGAYRNIVRNLEAVATYEIEAEARIPVAIIINDEKGVRQAAVERRVASTVERLGYEISDQAEFLMQGVVAVVDYEEVSGMAGTQIVARVRLDMQLVNRSTNTVIGSITGDGTGMSNRNEADALRASFNRINVNRRELSEVLSSLSDN